MGRRLADARAWMEAGTALMLEAVSGLDEEQFSRPSALPSWSRKHLVAHISANADALGNLIRWAATDEVTPMYASTERRNADIYAGGSRSAVELADACAASAARLQAAMDELSDRQWTVEVLSAQGRRIPAADIPWMRSREVMIHAVDLRSGLTFRDLPPGFLAALCEDIVITRGQAPGPAVRLEASDTGGQWSLGGDGDPVVATGPLCAIAAYLSGREATGLSPGVPPLPPWL